MHIGGLQKCSTIDFPGKVACVLFTQGCNFRCGFCHNPELVEPKRFVPILKEEEIFSFLKKRQKILDAVVISGGEPTLYSDLAEWFQRIKAMGFAIKLDTNGTHPEVLQSLIQNNLLDFVAMDVKHCLREAAYNSIIGTFGTLSAVKRSIQILMVSSIDYEFRTTLIQEIHKQEDVLTLAESLQGARQWTLQKFRPQKTLDRQWETFHPWSQEEIKSLRALLSRQFPSLAVHYPEI
jgi:pyruvate formate lyase activating enzyme